MEYQIVEELCDIVERQNEIICRLAARLAQLNALDASELQLLSEVRNRVQSSLGNT